MKWCRFQVGQHASYGIVSNETITEVAGTPFGEHTVTSTSHSLGQVKLLPPVIPPMLYAARTATPSSPLVRGSSPIWIP